MAVRGLQRGGEGRVGQCHRAANTQLAAGELGKGFLVSRRSSFLQQINFPLGQRNQQGSEQLRRGPADHEDNQDRHSRQLEVCGL